jgi:MYXO-CTERM domain-containing protein
MRSLRLAALFSAMLVALPASAHVGAVLATAKFTSPAPPTVTPAGPMGVTLSPYTFPTADQTFPVSWTDGDNDPTGHFYCYYFDHDPTREIQIADIQTVGTPAIDLATGQPAALWAGCMCPFPDMGSVAVICPDAGAGVRDCNNDFTWDTSKIAAGSYWLVALNLDPPKATFTIGGGPIRIAHAGAAPPPAVMVLRPDGFGTWDKSYRVQWYAQGKAPLKIDLAYGNYDGASVLTDPMPLAQNVQAIQNPDGTQSWDWDLTQLPSLTSYYLRVTVTDADGVKAFTDSSYGLSVYHNDSDGGAPADLGPRPDGGNLIIHPSSGCSCQLSGAGAATLFGPLALLALLALALLRRRRA